MGTGGGGSMPGTSPQRNRLPRTCQQKRNEAQNPLLLGAFVPKCKSDGTYEEKQCHGSTGHCWCVDSSSGVEIKGTRKGPGKGRVTCGELLIRSFVPLRSQIQIIKSYWVAVSYLAGPY